MSNTYQKNSRRAQPDGLPGEIAVPEQVIVSMTEIAESAKEGLLALAVGTGMQVMAAMFSEDAERLCGPDGRHNPGRAGYRHGTEAGSVTLGGRRVPVTRPRVRAADGSGELHLPSYDLFSCTEILGRLAMEKMLAGLSSRRYGHGLEPAGQAVESTAASTSKSAVSRRFVAATETALAELMTRRLDDLDLVALMIDGVHFGEHTCVVALGIGIDGTKHPLSLAEGSTENKTLVTGLITDLRDRGLDVTRPVLAVIDGSKALAAAVKAVFDNAQERLWPGEFVNVSVTERTDPDAITVPQAAVLIGQNTTYVYVIKDDSTAEMRPVKVARTVDGISVIADGLNPGERVATDGQLRLTTGSRVDIRSSSDKPETDSKS